MLNIHKCIVKEKNRFTVTEGDYVSFSNIRRDVKFLGPDHIVHSSGSSNNTEFKTVFHYTLEEVSTGKLHKLKIYENDLNIDDVIYIGEKNNNIVTYSNTDIDKNSDKSQEKSGDVSSDVKVVKSLKKLKTKDVLLAVVAFIGFLVPFVSTWMNFYLAFKHDFKSTKELYPEVNIKLVRFICAVCGFMPIFFTLKLAFFGILSLGVYMSSITTWGFISALVIVGGSIYLHTNKEKEIEDFTNKTK